MVPAPKPGPAASPRRRGTSLQGEASVSTRRAIIWTVAERQRVVSGSPFEPAVGFSRAVRVGDRVIVSGTGPVVSGGTCPADAAAQTRRCFEIVATALSEVGSVARRRRAHASVPHGRLGRRGRRCGAPRAVRRGETRRHHDRGGGTVGPRLEGRSRSRGGRTRERRS